MEYTQSDQPNNEPWSSSADYKKQSLKRKNTAPENKQKTETVGNNVIHEATIWQRPKAVVPRLPRIETVTSPILSQQQKPKLVPRAFEYVQHETPESSPPDAVREAVHEAYNTVSTEQQPAPVLTGEITAGSDNGTQEVSQPSVQGFEKDSTWVNTFANTPKAQGQYSGNPDFPAAPRRPYFWTDPEVRQPLLAQTEHDILPPVLSAANTLRQAEAATTERPLQEGPVLVAAINPNLGTISQTPHSPDLLSQAPATGDSWKQPTNGVPSFARRSPASAVKSQSMQYSTFEQGPVPMELLDGASAEEPIDYPAPFSRNREEGAAVRTEVQNSTERAARVPTETELQEHVRQVEMELSRTILIGGMSAYDMFIDKQIDAEGLHRIVVEYTRGGDVKNIAHQEVARQQIRFERDPQMRQSPVAPPVQQDVIPAVAAVSMAQAQLPSQPAIDRTERLAIFTQEASEKMQDFMQHPQLGTIGSVLAIVAIYSAIIIIILA